MTDDPQPTPRRKLAFTVALTLAATTIMVSPSARVSLAQDDHAHHHETASATAEASPVASTGTGIVYFSIVNTGTTPRLLVAAETDAAQDISFHASGDGGDVMRMTEQPGGFTIGPGETLTLEPGGAHIMLENLNHDLRPGTTFTIRLIFIDANWINVDVTVGAEAPDGEPNQLGELLISPAWSLPAPRLGDGPGGTPEATPHDSH